MPFQPMYHGGALARRDLRKEEMTRFALEKLPWLADPERIPEFASSWLDGQVAEGDGGYRHPVLASWMADQFVEMSQEVHGELGFGETFDRRGLNTAQRVEVRDGIMEDSRPSYGTGIMAVSEIHSAVPYVAMRDGADVEEWGDIASRARAFGEKLAHDGSDVTGTIRLYLHDRLGANYDRFFFDPGKLKLDSETGITSVTSVDTMVALARATVRSMKIVEPHSGICVALHAKPETSSERSLFDRVWDAYSFAARRDIYPRHKPVLSEIRPREEPDTDEGLMIAFLALLEAIHNNPDFLSQD